MKRPDDFHELRERVRLVGTLETTTGLRVGSGGGGLDDAVDLPVLRDVDGYPFIPGSSIKGVLRSTLEALVRGSGAEGSVWTCDPLSGEGCGDHESGRREDVDVDGHCLLCRVFGSHVLASHVRVSDAMIPPDGRRGFVPIERRDGVAIDRDLGVAVSGQKYDFEVVAAGTRFTTEVFVENPEPWMLGLLTVGFDQIDDGFSALGGFTSRGLGRVRMTWTEVTRVTARGLLAGEPPEVLTDTLGAERDAWRKALTELAFGGGAS